MGGHLFPEIRCAICGDPVDLVINLCADENGEPIHEDCYVKRITIPLRKSASVYDGRLSSHSATP
jgi:hypothetical protein